MTTGSESAGRADGGKSRVADRLGYQLKHAQRRFDRFRDEGLAPLGVTGRHCAVLAVIGLRGQLPQHEIARELTVDRTTLVGLIDELEGRGLVARSPQPGDRRKNIVSLTDEGRRVLRDSEGVRERAEQQFFEHVSSLERESFQSILSAIVDTDQSS